MADTANTNPITEKKEEKKLYPSTEDDVKYELEIVDAIKKLPVEQRLQAIAINFYQLQKKRLDDITDSQIDEIVKKFNALQAPIAERANQLIAGEVLPNDEEIIKMNEHLNDEEKTTISANLVNESIPDYWFKVLTTCERLSQDIFEADHPLLKKISKIEHIPSNDDENFEIKFHFFPNDYIENQWLSVKFTMIEDGQDPEKSEATEVKWKEGKDITKKTVTKKQKNKKTGKTRTVEKVVDAESFFNFFKSVSPKDGGDDAGDDEEGGDEDLERLNINFDIATTLQEEIVPYHLEYYLGLRKGDDYGAMGDDEGDDDEDGDGDDDDDEPEEKPAKGKGKKGGAGAGAAAGGKAGEKPECKQQ